MKLLSLKELKSFDYVKTKEKVLAYLEDINLAKYKYLNVMPPSIVSRLYDIRVQSTPISRSRVESYVILKEEFEREFKDKLEEIDSIISTMSKIEQRFFIDHYIHGTKIILVQDQFKCGRERIDTIKKSATIKFALLVGIEVYK